MHTETTPESSRDATNRLLGALRSRHWSARAWGRFLTDAGTRSVEQAMQRPGALIEVSGLHGLMLLVGGRRSGPNARWAMTSWALAAFHLGMLESRSTLGAANALTLVRAMLPVTNGLLGRWIGLVAMGTDFVDGRLARHTRTTASFGLYADALADTAFWF